MKSTFVNLGKLGLIAAVLMTATLMFISSADTQTPTEQEYEPGVLIIKLKYGHTINELAVLNAQYHVISSERLFPDRPSPETTLADLQAQLAAAQAAGDTALAQQLQQKITWQQDLIDRLAIRNQRVTPGAVPQDLSGYYVLRVGTSTDLVFMADSYLAHEAVEYAGPNFYFDSNTTPADQHYTDGRQSYYQTNSWEQVWDESTGKYADGRRVRVAVIGTGFDFANYSGEINWATDSYGNHGWDYTEGDASPQDEHGHETNVISIIGSKMNNDLYAGGAPDAEILVYRVSSPQNPTSHQQDNRLINEAVDEAVAQGAEVINISNGGPIPPEWLDKLFNIAVMDNEATIRNATQQGTVIIISAGNGGSDQIGDPVDTQSPARMASEGVDGVMVVAAVDKNGDLAPWSNYGPDVFCFPGEEIYGLDLNSEDTWRTGTSQAAPQLTALVADILAVNPFLTPVEIEQIVIDTCIPFGDPNKTGHGMVDPKAAIDKAKAALQLYITSPASGSCTGGDVDIQGTANQGVRYELSSDPGGYIAEGIPNITNGHLGTWPTASLSDGEYKLKITLFTQDGKSVSRFVKVKLDNHNDPPLFVGLTNKAVEIGDTLSFQVIAKDPDCPNNSGCQGCTNLAYSATGDLSNDIFSRGATFTPIDAADPSKGYTFSWTPTDNDKGSYNVTFTVDDAGTNPDNPPVSQTITIETLAIKETYIDQGIFPRIYKNTVAYFYPANTPTEIRIYDLETKAVVNHLSIPSTSYHNSFNYSDNTLVWESNYKIYILDVPTQTLLIKEKGLSPNLWEKVLVYEARNNPDYVNDGDIYLYHTGTRGGGELSQDGDPIPGCTNDGEQFYFPNWQQSPFFHSWYVLWKEIDPNACEDNWDTCTGSCHEILKLSGDPIFSHYWHYDGKIRTVGGQDIPFRYGLPPYVKDMYGDSVLARFGHAFALYSSQWPTGVGWKGFKFESYDVTYDAGAEPEIDDLAIYKDTVVWSECLGDECDPPNYHIKLYALMHVFNENEQYEFKVADTVQPTAMGTGAIDIEEDNIVWQDTRNGGNSIYVAHAYYPPQVSSLSSYLAAAGDTIKIQGENFGTLASDVNVSFNGIVGEVKNCTDTEIEVEVPQDAGSSQSVEVEVETPGGDTVIATPLMITSLSAPENLVASDNGTSVKLTWTDNSAGLAGFTIERGTSENNFAVIGTTNQGEVTFGDTPPVAGTTYYYRVQAFAGNVVSGYSNTVSVNSGVPLAPTNLSATALSYNQVQLSWTNTSSFATGVKVERRKGLGSYVEIGTVAMPDTSYIDTAAEEQTYYTYRVRAYSASGDSAYSDVAAASTPLAPPQAPSNLTGNAMSISEISLAWDDNSATETGFKVWRSPDGNANTFTEIASLSVNVTSYTDTGLSRGTTYYYKVTAVNSAGSTASNAVSAATLPTIPPTVALVESGGSTVVGVLSDQISVAVDDADGYADLSEILFKIEDAADPTKYVVLRYSVSLNATGALLKNYYISNNVPDPADLASATWLGPYSTGTYSDANGYLSMNVGSTTLTKTTTKITSNFKLTFNALFGLSEKNFYVYAKDDYAGQTQSGWGSVRGTWFVDAKPALGDVTPDPASGNVYADEPVFFLANYTDDNGAANIERAEILLSTLSNVFASRPFAKYDNVNKKFYLSNGTGTTEPNTVWVEQPATGDYIENAYCKLYFKDSSVTSNGNQLTINWKFSFKSGFVTDTTKLYLWHKVWDIPGEVTSSTFVKKPNLTSSYWYIKPSRAPSGLTASTSVPRPSIQLAWTDNSADEDGFKIKRSTDGINFTEIATVAAGKTSYSDTALAGATNTTQYTYKVYAYKGTSDYGSSNQASITTIGALQSTVDPAVGTAAIGQPAVFKVSCSKPTSSYYLKDMYILFNTSPNENTGFYVRYNHAEGKLYLYDNGSWGTGRRIGRAGTLSNANGSLDCAKAKVTTSGGNTIIELPISFTAAFSGLKNIYVRATDTDGWDSGDLLQSQRKATCTIGAAPANQPPVLGTVTTSQAGGKTYFTATYSDPDGVDNINIVGLAIGYNVNGQYEVAAIYSNQNSTIAMYDDTNTTFVGSYKPGTIGATLENSQGIIDCENATVTKDANTKTMTFVWPVTFKSGYTGEKNVYLYVKDIAGSEVLEQKGTWTVTP